MLKVIDDKFVVDIFCDAFEPECVLQAAGDLQSDLRKVSGLSPVVKRYLPYEEQGFIVIGSLQNERFREYAARQGIDVTRLAGTWENYLLKTFGSQHQNLLICGSDQRGTMFGVYEFCAEYLGVDPLYFWTDNEPAVRTELSLGPINQVSGPQTFKFRGWFINDEDLLTEWKAGGGTRYIDYPFYHQVVNQAAMAKVLETALRLKQNLIIPASFLDIDNPSEENFVRMATERGLFVSQHHVEPMGVSHFGWDNYWRRKGQDIPASYVLYPEKFAEIWRHYCEKWAQYPNIIWQFGLRGRGDRPVWTHDHNVPSSMEDRGKLISSAIAQQAEIVKDVLGHDDFYSTMTAWAEGVELHNAGYLSFPKNTMIIFADHGSTQMWGDDFSSVDRDPDTEYGVYYHVAFWADGPHLVQGTPPAKMYHNYQRAVEKKDTAYSILNVTSVREVLVGIRANSQMTWDFASFNPDDFLQVWAKEEFGPEAAPAVAAVYSQFYEAYYKLDNTQIPGHKMFIDGMVRRVGLRFIEMLHGVPKGEGYKLLDKSFDPMDFASSQAFIEFYRRITAEALVSWREVYSSAYQTLPLIREERRQFFIDNLVVQLEVIYGLYDWVHQLSKAAGDIILEGKTAKDNPHLKKAVYALEKLLLDRKKAEHGKWQNWYRGDKKMNMQAVLDQTRQLLRKEG
ncbi:MAG: glycosyl hydrolase 115 family protein [Limnochordia bacterium]